MLEKADYGVNKVLTGMLINMSKCNKPIVTVVRGGCIGIGFTMLSHSTFLYCSPDAYFKTPFMESGQSPEGTSTYLFPKIFGPRLANELLLTDRVLTAKEALNTGFANGIVDSFDPKSEWFDPSIIPVIPKLLKNDVNTMTNCMQEINFSKANDRIAEITAREGEALVATWTTPEFMMKMKAYLKQTLNKKEQAKM